MSTLTRCERCSTALGEIIPSDQFGEWLCGACARARSRDNDRADFADSGSSVPKGRNVSSSYVAGSSVDVPVPVPSVGEEELPGERADLEVQLDRYHAGDLHVEPPELPRLPEWATPAMERVLGDMVFCSTLLRTAGDDGTVIYAVDWAAKRLRLSGSTVSVALRRLRKCGAIRLVKVLPSLSENRAGSRVYAVAPPVDVLPPRPLAVEAGRSGDGRIHDRQEAGEHVAVREAISNDGRKVSEGDDGLCAAESGATVIGHTAEITPEGGYVAGVTGAHDEPEDTAPIDGAEADTTVATPRSAILLGLWDDD